MFFNKVKVSATLQPLKNTVHYMAELIVAQSLGHKNFYRKLLLIRISSRISKIKLWFREYFAITEDILIPFWWVGKQNMETKILLFRAYDFGTTSFELSRFYRKHCPFLVLSLNHCFNMTKKQSWTAALTFQTQANFVAVCTANISVS